MPAANADREVAADSDCPVADLVHRAKAAMEAYENTDQDRVDMAVRAVAWSICKPENARMLAERAVADTGLGNVESKVAKNVRKTFGTLRDLLRVKTVGVVEERPDRGLTVYGKPVGVVGAVCPSTNPSATPANKAMMALKGGNAIIVAPSPAGYRTSAATVELMRSSLVKSGHPADLVQALPPPATKAKTKRLAELADLVVVTGSQNNVRQAMTSGKVAIGVGPGNVPVIVDSSADLDDAAEKIAASKTFDNATSCSSENSLVVLEDIYEDAMQALRRFGGWRCTADERARIASVHWQDGGLSRRVIGKDASVVAEAAGLPEEASSARFFLVEEQSVEGKRSFSDEKLSLVLAVHRARDFAEAKEIAQSILEVCGKGHSVGIHTKDERNARSLAEDADVVRVLVNQAHTFGNGGGFDNALPFTLSMGGGTWANNVISENLNYKHFINLTHLVTTIPEDRPSEEELFGPYWSEFGK